MQQGEEIGNLKKMRESLILLKKEYDKLHKKYVALLKLNKKFAEDMSNLLKKN